MRLDALRIANNLDAKKITQLVNVAYRPNGNESGWTHESNWISGDRISADRVSELISKVDSVILLGIKDHEILTCVHVEKEGQNAYIGMLTVHPKSQGLGIGKQVLDYAEKYAGATFGSDKFVMVVMSARSELIAFYLRRGYQKTGRIMDNPSSAGVGTPKFSDLKIEVLEKPANTSTKLTGNKDER